MEEQALEPVAQSREQFIESQNEIIDAFVNHLGEAPVLESTRETHKYQAIMPEEDTNVEQALSNLESLHRNTSIGDVISNFRRYSSETLNREQSMFNRLVDLERVATVEVQDDFI